MNEGNITPNSPDTSSPDQQYDPPQSTVNPTNNGQQLVGQSPTSSASVAQQPPVTTLPASDTTPAAEPLTPVQKLRSILIKSMLGCLIVAAAVAVGAVLIGEFNQTTWRALGTVFAAIIHIGILFAVISTASSKVTHPSIERAQEFVINTAIVIAVMSFFTTVLGTWDVLTGDVPAKFYGTYAVVLFAVLHVKTLFDIQILYQKARNIIYANYGFIFFVAILLLYAIWAGTEVLSGFTGRLLAAAAIIDATLSIIAAVLFKLHAQKDPELAQQLKGPTRSASTKVIIAILLFIFVVWPVIQFIAFFSGGFN